MKNLIVDLGGVIVDLDVQRSANAMMELANAHSFAPGQFLDIPLFHDFEKGLLSADTFRAELRSILDTDATDAQLDQAWNAMIVGLPADRLSWLTQLRDRGNRLFLLSNTNEIHIDHLGQLLATTYGQHSLDPWFDRCYYSHRLGMRKPDPEIYLHIVRENSLRPSETTMIDDNLLNLAGAAQAGLHTYHVERPEHVFRFK